MAVGAAFTGTRARLQWHNKGGLSPYIPGNNGKGMPFAVGEEFYYTLLKNTSLKNSKDRTCGVCSQGIGTEDGLWSARARYICLNCGTRLCRFEYIEEINNWVMAYRLLNTEVEISIGLTHRCSQCTLMRCAKDGAWCQECAENRKHV